MTMKKALSILGVVALTLDAPTPLYGQDLPHASAAGIPFEVESTSSPESITQPDPLPLGNALRSAIASLIPLPLSRSPLPLDSLIRPSDAFPTPLEPSPSANKVEPIEIPNVSGQLWRVQADRVIMRGIVVAGVREITTSNGPITILELHVNKIVLYNAIISFPNKDNTYTAAVRTPLATLEGTPMVLYVKGLTATMSIEGVDAAPQSIDLSVDSPSFAPFRKAGGPTATVPDTVMENIDLTNADIAIYMLAQVNTMSLPSARVSAAR